MARAQKTPGTYYALPKEGPATTIKWSLRKVRPDGTLFRLEGRVPVQHASVYASANKVSLARAQKKAIEEAEKRAVEELEKAYQGFLGEPREQRRKGKQKPLLVEEWCTYAFEHCYKNTKPKVLHEYRRIIDTEFIPRFGKRKLIDLRAEDGDALMKDFEDRNLSVRSRRNYFNAINRILNLAVERKKAAENPFRLCQVRKEASVTFHRPYFTQDECALLLNEAKGTPIFGCVVAALGAGLRVAECCGLRFTDCDLEKGTMRIQNQLQRIEGVLQEFPPKGKVIEPIFIPESLTAVIRGEAASKMVDGKETPYVFTHHDGRPFAPDYVYHRFIKVMDRAGIARNVGQGNRTFHSLRTTFATNLAIDGRASSKTIMLLLRQATPGIADRHYIQATESEAMRVSKEASDQLLASLR